MPKNLVSITLILLSCGILLYLDCLNRQEKRNLVQIRQGIDQVRAEARKRETVKTVFATQQLVSLNHCLKAADTAKSKYTNIMLKMPPHKRDQLVIFQKVMKESEKIYPAAKAVCQQGYEARIKEGV